METRLYVERLAIVTNFSQGFANCKEAYRG